MRRLSISLIPALVLSVVATSVAHAATTRFVSPTGTNAGDCSDSANPCATFNFAISKAVAGDTISAAAGTYNETQIDINIDLTVTGAGPATTIIDAAGGAGPLISVESVTTTISNLTVENESLTDTCGGGISSLLNGVVTLSNITVSNNTTEAAFGGGVCNFGQMTIRNSLIGGADNVANGNKAFNNFAGGGIVGGGIYNAGTLTLDNTTVSANSTEDEQNSCAGNGGGIFNDLDATLTINNSTISGNIAKAGDNCGIIDGNGGGIFNTVAILVIDHSLIEANQAANEGAVQMTGGGGIFNQGGDVTVRNGSTINGNFAVNGDTGNPTAGGGGGGIYHVSSDCGGGDCPFNPNLNISNSTISNNISFSDGGGIHRDSFMTLTNVTVSGNTAVQGEAGGIHNNGVAPACLLPSCPGTLINVTLANNKALNTGGISANNILIPTLLKNTLIAQNVQTSDNTNANCAPSDTALSSQNHNLSDDDTCTNFLTQTQDIKNQPAGIGPLADNGGNYPSNPPFTHALLTGSQAIDAIPPADCLDAASAALTVDERNFPRPGVNLGPNCDIGAFELQAVVPTPTATPIPTPTATPIPTPTSIPTPIPTLAPIPSATPIPPAVPQFVEGSGNGCSLSVLRAPNGLPILVGLLFVPVLLRGLLRKWNENR